MCYYIKSCKIPDKLIFFLWHCCRHALFFINVIPGFLSVVASSIWEAPEIRPGMRNGMAVFGTWWLACRQCFYWHVVDNMLDIKPWMSSCRCWRQQLHVMLTSTMWRWSIMSEQHHATPSTGQSGKKWCWVSAITYYGSFIRSRSPARFQRYRTLMRSCTPPAVATRKPAWKHEPFWTCISDSDSESGIPWNTCNCPCHGSK